MFVVRVVYPFWKPLISTLAPWYAGPTCPRRRGGRCRIAGIELRSYRTLVCGSPGPRGRVAPLFAFPNGWNTVFGRLPPPPFAFDPADDIRRPPPLLLLEPRPLLPPPPYEPANRPFAPRLYLAIIVSPAGELDGIYQPSMVAAEDQPCGHGHLGTYGRGGRFTFFLLGLSEDQSHSVQAYAVPWSGAPCSGGGAVRARCPGIPSWASSVCGASRSFFFRAASPSTPPRTSAPHHPYPCQNHAHCSHHQHGHPRTGV